MGLPLQEPQWQPLRAPSGSERRTRATANCKLLLSPVRTCAMPTLRALDLATRATPMSESGLARVTKRRPRRQRLSEESLTPSSPRTRANSPLTFRGDIFAKKIFFEVMDKDTFSADDKIGEA